MIGALPDIVAAPDDHDARSRALYAAWLSGLCLGSVGMALHHKLCHVLGGTFNLPHAETHSIILPHAMAYNSVAVPEVAKRVAEMLGASDAASAARFCAQLRGGTAVGHPDCSFSTLDACRARVRHRGGGHCYKLH